MILPSKDICYCLASKLCLTLLTLVIPWIGAHEVPLFMRYPRQEYWSGFPFPPPGELSSSGIEPVSPALAGGFFTIEPPGKDISDSSNPDYFSPMGGMDIPVGLLQIHE